MGKVRLDEGKSRAVPTLRTVFTGRSSVLALLTRTRSCKCHRRAAISVQAAGNPVDVG